MTKAKFVPAVTETKTIEVSPAKVVLELTPEEAGKLRALAGKVSHGHTFGLFDALCGTNGIPVYACENVSVNGGISIGFYPI